MKGTFSTADEPTSCGEVSRKSVQIRLSKSVWKNIIKKYDAKCNCYTEGDHKKAGSASKATRLTPMAVFLDWQLD